MHTETNTPFPEQNVQWLWKQWTNVLRMRRDGIPVLGFTWYSLVDQMDWDTQLTEKHNIKPDETFKVWPTLCATWLKNRGLLNR